MSARSCSSCRRSRPSSSSCRPPKQRSPTRSSNFTRSTGNRGMQNLLVRDQSELPAAPTGINSSAALTQTGGAYQALSSGVQSLMTGECGPYAAASGRLSPAEQAHLQAARQSAALLQSTSRQALDNTSARFASLQQLINAIPSATDQKGALDFRRAFKPSRRCCRTRTRRWRCSIRRSKRRSGRASKARANRSSRAWARCARCRALTLPVREYRLCSFGPVHKFVRIRLGLVVTLTSAAGCAPAPDRARHTVEEYRQDADLRKIEIARCANDPGPATRSPDCMNAREAERLEMGIA